MEQMLRFLPVLISIMQSPAAKQVLDAFGGMAQKEFPTLPPEQAQEAMSTVSRENEVLWIQTALTMLGTATPVDGVYGPGVKSVVSDFQGKNGLSVDGWAGKETQKKMRDMLLAMKGAK